MIEGELVNLRAPEMADLERNHAWVNDSEVVRFLTLRYQIALAAEEEWLRTVAGRMAGYGSTFFAIDTKDGRHIGNTNYFNCSPENRSAEVGIMIGDKSYWSKGYGTDAMRTLLRFGFDEMNLQRVELWVYGRNARARACYRKCGYVEEAVLREDVFRDGAYDDAVVMSVLRDEHYGREGRKS